MPAGRTTDISSAPASVAIIVATYSGDTSFQGSFSPQATVQVQPAPIACTTTITGTHSTQLNITSGETCLVNAKQSGQVTVGAGAALSVTNSTVSGTVTATGAASISYCGSTENGTLKVTGTTGVVTLGGTRPDGSNCAADTIPSLITVSDTGGPVTVSGNKVNGSLYCTGNTPAPSDSGP